VFASTLCIDASCPIKKVFTYTSTVIISGGGDRDRYMTHGRLDIPLVSRQHRTAL
jgi:hypothetical protein